MSLIRTLGIAFLFALAGLSSSALASRADSAIPDRPNFVIVVTDDQRWDTLSAMPFVNKTLRPLALDFRHAYVTTPECCPARASLLAGGFYAHNTGVLRNGGPSGGAPSFDDSRTMALKLYRAGYRTALIGKYMNGYFKIAPRIPPGWTHFVGTVVSGNWRNHRVAVGSSSAKAATGRIESPGGHLTEYQFAEAARFLDGISGEPYFLLVTTDAPHDPAVPLPQDARRYSDYRYRKRAWGEEDLSDKPIFVRRRARDFEEKIEASDAFHRDQLRALAAVDRGVEALYELVASRGELESTVFVFTSDNGFLWGEHRLEGKNLPYEESIRVPFLVSLAGANTGERDNLVAMNLDLGATILDLAGLHPKARALARNTDGWSLRPFLEGPIPGEDDWRQDLLVESFSRGFAALLTREPFGGVERHAKAGWTWKYVEHYPGSQREAYRSDIDRFEIESVDKDPEFRTEYRDLLENRLHQLRGLYSTTESLPPGRLGKKYRKTLNALGGAEPYLWSIADGEVPRGLRLQRKKGKLVGKPREAGEFEFAIRLEASSIARYTRRPQTVTREYRLQIEE